MNSNLRCFEPQRLWQIWILSPCFSPRINDIVLLFYLSSWACSYGSLLFNSITHLSYKSLIGFIRKSLAPSTRTYLSHASMS
jgi:hypothetical protein